MAGGRARGRHLADRRRWREWQTIFCAGRVLVVDPPKKLVQTWRYDWDPHDSVTTITWRFDAIEGGTRVTVRHEGFGEAHAACDNHALGWEKVLGWLSQGVEVRP